MGRNRKQPESTDFLFFDVLYQDGARTSNRKVARDSLDDPDNLDEIRAVIEAQDRAIAERSGHPRGPIKALTKSAR